MAEIDQIPQEETPEERKRRAKAKNRVNMRIHCTIFILVCALLWVLYFFLFKDSDLGRSMLKFCAGLTLIWFIIVYFHYLVVFKWGKSYVDKEVRKLRKKEQQEKEKEQQEQMESGAVETQGSDGPFAEE